MKKNDKTHTGEWRPWSNEKVHVPVDKQVQDAEERGRKKGMVQGLALAINYSLRGESERTIWGSTGLSVEECISNDVDWYDLEKLIQEFATVDEVEIIAGYLIRTQPEGSSYEMYANEFITEMNKVLMTDMKGKKLHETLAAVKQSYLDKLKG